MTIHALQIVYRAAPAAQPPEQVVTKQDILRLQILAARAKGAQ